MTPLLPWPVVGLLPLLIAGLTPLPITCPLPLLIVYMLLFAAYVGRIPADFADRVLVASLGSEGVASACSAYADYYSAQDCGLCTEDKAQ